MVNRNILVQAKRAAQLSIVEYRYSYTFMSWLFGWCTRLVFQVLFFSMIGVVVGGPGTVEYLLIGNVVAVAALEATTVVVAMTREHHYGTLASLVASPGSPVVALLFGNISWPFTGLLSAGVTAAATIAILGQPFGAVDLLVAYPLVLVCALSAFCFGATIGAVVLSFPSLSFTAMNLAYLSLMTFTGVNVPVGFWPQPVEWLAHILPVTHGLLAVRAVLADGPATGVMLNLTVELLVGGMWLVVAALVLRWSIARWRRRGSLDFPT